jgi:hypothetical protein
MAVPMSLASVDARIADATRPPLLNPMNAMSEQTKASKTRVVLPCQWVEEDSFEVTPSPGPVNDPQALPDTAFLLNASQPPRPTQSPNS